VCWMAGDHTGHQRQLFGGSSPKTGNLTPPP
jgi:hypothetical protein